MGHAPAARHLPGRGAWIIIGANGRVCPQGAPAAPPVGGPPYAAPRNDRRLSFDPARGTRARHRCTEPIALAYAAARLRALLGVAPARIEAEISGNIIKNVKSVVVPNTGGRKGIAAAIAAGVVAGDAARELQVIAEVPAAQHAAIGAYADATPIAIRCADTTRLLDIRLTGFAGAHTATVQIANSHTNIVFESRDGETLLQKPFTDSPEDNLTDKSVLNVADIWNLPTPSTWPACRTCWRRSSPATSPSRRRGSPTPGARRWGPFCWPKRRTPTPRPRPKPGRPPAATRA